MVRRRSNEGPRRLARAARWCVVCATLTSGIARADGVALRAVETSTPTGEPAVEEILEQVREERLRIEALLAEMGGLEEFLLNTEPGAPVDASQPLLSIYGFFETGLQRTWSREQAFLNGIQQTPAWSFILGNLNVYLDARPAPNWRALIELRLTTSHGAFTDTGGDGDGLLLNTSERGINGPGIGLQGRFITSSLVIERAQVEWQYNDLLGLRLGLWLTPWGIWNVDHGSPTRIPLLPPFQSNDIFPTQQLGAAAFGTIHLSSWQLGYHLGVSNGRFNAPTTVRDATSSSFDLTDDKMISGRLVLTRSGPSRFSIGASGIWGTTSRDARKIISLEPLRVKNEVDLELEEWGAGGDLSWDPGGIRIRAELMYSRYRYPKARPLSTFFPLVLQADSEQWAGYGLMSVPLRAGTIGIEPYIYTEAFWMPSALAPIELSTMGSLGLNLDLAPAVRLKVQYGYMTFFDVEDGNPRRSAVDDIHLLSSRAVVSF